MLSATVTTIPVMTTHAAIPSSVKKAAFRSAVLSHSELESIFFTKLQAASPVFGLCGCVAREVATGVEAALGGLICGCDTVRVALGSEPEAVVGVELTVELCDGGDGGGAPLATGTEGAWAPGVCVEEEDAAGALPTGATGGLAEAALEAAGAAGEVLGAGVALAGETVHGVIGGAVNVPAVDVRFGSGSALFE